MTKYLYECPKCGNTGGGDVAPTYPPHCNNEEGHHHPRPVRMVFLPNKSTVKEEPKYKTKEDK